MLNGWGKVAGRVAEQRDDAQSVTMNEVITSLQVDPQLDDLQERNLVAYIDALPRDLRFALVKALVRIPQVASAICKDEYDAVVLDVISEISREAS